MTRQAPPRPVVPPALPLAGALAGSAPLQSLGARLRASEARLAAVRGCLPPALAPHVQAGPIDEAGWSLLARNAGVAAKLRHLLPTLEAALAEAGLPVASIRIRVCP